MRTILSCFAGREPNIEILRKYLQKAFSNKIIDEVHYWNYCRNPNDEQYLKRISNLKRTSSTGQGNYIEIFTTVDNNCFTVKAKCNNDFHIKMTCGSSEYEIVLGEYKNASSVIRKKQDIIAKVQGRVLDENKHVEFKVCVANNALSVYSKDSLIIQASVDHDFNIEQIFINSTIYIFNTI